MTLKSPPKTLPERVAGDLTDLFKPYARALLAVSGGSDSTGLMHVMAGIAATDSLEIVVGFVHHGLRQEAEQEYEQVKKQAEKIGLALLYRQVPADEATVAARSGSIQAWARKVRYAHLTDMAREAGCDCIATAHTLDDQAETVVQRLVRGTGLDGISGIPRVRTLETGIDLVRPFLNVTRGEIREYLGSIGVDWSDDPSNRDTRFTRVRIRNEILPAIDSLQPGIACRLASLADEAGRLTDFIDNDYLASKIDLKNLLLSNGVKVTHNCFSALPEALRDRAIRLVLKRVRGDLRRIERVHIDQILRAINDCKSTGSLSLPGEAIVHVDRGAMYAFPGPLLIDSGPALRLKPAADGVWKARSKTLAVAVEIEPAEAVDITELSLRTRRPGDKLWNSNSKFKQVLIEARVPRPYRELIPVIADEARVISTPYWVKNRRPDLKIRWHIEDDSPLNDIKNEK
jgi:tRNA(Ile)-lysidine synthase